MAAPLSKENVIFGRDIHNLAGEGEGIGQNGGEFGGAVGEGHGAEAVG